MDNIIIREDVTTLNLYWWLKLQLIFHLTITFLLIHKVQLLQS